MRMQLNPAETRLLTRVKSFDTTPREIVIEQEGPTTIIGFDFFNGRWQVLDPVTPGNTFLVSPSMIPVGATPDELQGILGFLNPPVGVGGIKPVLAEAETLIRGALEGVLNNDPEGALWRLVDAAGVVARVTEDDARGQEGRPTGRGFFIGGVPSLSSTHRRR